jgi:hypothetical protein
MTLPLKFLAVTESPNNNKKFDHHGKSLLAKDALSRSVSQFNGVAVRGVDISGSPLFNAGRYLGR